MLMKNNGLSEGRRASSKNSAEETCFDSNNKNIDSILATCNNNGNSTHPLECVYDPTKHLFLVTKNRGAKLSTGGWGVPISDDHTETIITPNDLIESQKPANTTTTKEYLFIEQVVFLHERGMLKVFESANETKPLSLQDLFRRLESHGVSLPAYLVYAHLCKQTYRVLRHSTTRLPLLSQLKEQPHNNILKKELRRNLAQTVVPSLDETCNIWWDVYQPDKSFKRSNPGLPDFCVAGATICGKPVTFSQISMLLQTLHDQPTIPSISLKIASVSDSGTVLLLGVHPLGVPSINDSEQTI